MTQFKILGFFVFGVALEYFKDFSNIIVTLWIYIVNVSLCYFTRLVNYSIILINALEVSDYILIYIFIIITLTALLFNLNINSILNIRDAIPETPRVEDIQDINRKLRNQILRSPL